MKRRRAIFLLIFLGTLLILAAIAAAYFVTRRVSYDATIKAPGLSDKVTIHRSAEGIPRIEANSREDICFALGYLHAQDRYVVLEYFRAMASGSIDKIIGPDGKKLKRIINAAGIRSTADRIAGELESPHREMIQAYAKGINLIRHQWFQQFHGSIINRDWDMRDVIAILVLRDWSHAYLQNRELLFPIPQDKKKWLLHEIIPKTLLSAYTKPQAEAIQQLKTIRNLLIKYIGPFNRGFAFAVTPERTRKRLTRSAFNLKSSMNIYPGWYPVHILIGDIKIFGITQAGLPFIYCGNNQNISFYGFNLNVDTQTFYSEQTREFQGIIRYRSGRGWQEFKSVKEPYFDKGEITRHDIVWHSDNGPILNNIWDSTTESETTLSMKYIYPDAGYIVSLLEIPFSENIETARKKVAGINSIPRVYLFTGSNGMIKSFSGRMPRHNPTGNVLRTGPWSGWQGLQDLSRFTTRDFRKSITGSSFLYDAPQLLKVHGNNRSNRYRRLESLLGRKQGVVTGEKLKKILKDIHSIRAENFTPQFIKMLQPNPVTSARLSRVYFKDWDFSMKKTKVAPAIFERLLYNFIIETVKDEIPYLMGEVKSNYHLMEDNFYKIVTAKGSMFFDDTTTENIENREMIFDRAFLKSMRWLNRRRGPIMNDWYWGSLHRGHYRIPIEEKTIFSRYIYEISDIAMEGSYGTIYNDSAHSKLKPLSSTSVLGFMDNESIHAAFDFTYSVNPMSQFYYGRESSQDFKDITITASEHKTVITPPAK